MHILFIMGATAPRGGPYTGKKAKWAAVKAMQDKGLLTYVRNYMGGEGVYGPYYPLFDIPPEHLPEVERQLRRMTIGYVKQPERRPI